MRADEVKAYALVVVPHQLTLAAVSFPGRMRRRPTLCASVANELGSPAQAVGDSAVARTKLRANLLGTQLARPWA
jgi:hypothetical protein